MAYCSKCGSELASGVKFCAKCGNPVSTNGSSNEADFDYDYFEKLRQQGIFEAEKSLSKLKRNYIIIAIFGLGGVYFGRLDGFLNGCAAVYFGFCFVLGIVMHLNFRKNYNEKLEKLESMTAHDLYLEKKRNSETWQKVGTGLKAVNTGLKILRFFQ